MISDASNTCVSYPGVLEPHQSVEHQHVVCLLVRRLHHNAEEGVQRVLQELPSTTRRKKIKRISIKTETAASSRRPSPRVADLDDLAALHLHQPLQDLLQVVGVGPPVQQTQQIHWETEQDQSNTREWEWPVSGYC